MDLKEITGRVEIIAAEVAAFIMKESGCFDKNQTKLKGLNDFVSYVDISAEKMLSEKLGKLLPEAGFHAEEGTSSRKGSKYCWIVDPLDGTTNFLHNLHPFSISIALTENDQLIAGVVYEAAGRETFTAWKDGGAWLNRERINVSQSPSLSNSLIATGFPYKDFDRIENYLKCFEHLLRNSQGVRRMGSAAIDLAYVACGRFEGFFEYGLNPWDVAAGIIIIREAGGIVTDFSGDGNNISGNEIVAANNLVYNELLEIVSKFMVQS